MLLIQGGLADVGAFKGSFHHSVSAGAKIPIVPVEKSPPLA
jgi:hypothetical protein